MAKSEKDKIKSRIQKMTTRFRKADAAVGEKRGIWAMLDKFDRGEQWGDSAVPPWVPKPVTNFVRFVRTLKRANLASSISRANFTPVEVEDKGDIDRLVKAYNHVWDTENVPRTIRRSVDRALLQGTAIAYVYTDMTYTGGKYYGENDARNALYQGKICIERFPITNFFPDPDAYRLCECKYVETTALLPLELIKENPAFRKYCEEQGNLDALDALNHDMLERSNDSSGEIFDRDNAITNASQVSEGDEMATLHTHWERYYKNGEWHVNVTHYMVNMDFELYREEDVAINEYPFAVLYDEEEEQDFFGTSTIMDFIENQKIVNKLQQTAAILGVLHQNPQKIVFRESGINAQELARTGTLPGKVWTSNVPGEQAITVVKPMDIPKGLFELDDRTQNNIREMVGVNEAYTGQSVGSLTTSTGVQDLIERATIRDKDKMVQIDEFVEQISHLIVLNILHMWEDERPISQPQPNGDVQYEKFQPFDKLTRKNLQWRVKSNVYAKAPMTQASRRQQADKLLQTQGQFQFNPPVIIPEEFIKYQEFDDGQDILKRMQKDRERMEMEKAQNLTQQMVQVAQQYQQAIAQGQSPEQAAQIAQQAAQKLVEQQQAQDAKNGVSSQQQDSQAPKGVTSQVAMANMANGG